MATFTIGKQTYEVPELSLKKIKKIWPFVEGVQGSEDLLKLMDAAAEIISIALSGTEHELSSEQIEEQMLGSEMLNIQSSIEDLLVESGLLQRKGDGSTTQGEATGEAESASTETGTASSESLSPPVAPAETGS